MRSSGSCFSEQRLGKHDDSIAQGVGDLRLCPEVRCTVHLNTSKLGVGYRLQPGSPSPELSDGRKDIVVAVYYQSVMLGQLILRVVYWGQHVSAEPDSELRHGGEIDGRSQE